MATATQMRGEPFVILLYHGVDSGEPFVGKADPHRAEYVLRSSLFEDHLASLRAHGYRVLPLEECLNGAASDEPVQNTVVLTFDDGEASCADVIAPMLERHHFHADFFIVSGFINQPGYLTTTQIKELVARGHRIHSHSATHRFLTSLSQQALEEELRGSKDVIEAITGQAVRFFSIPNGVFDRRVLEAARHAGYQRVLSSVEGYNAAAPNQFLLRRFAMRSYTTTASLVTICESRTATVCAVATKRMVTGVLKATLSFRGYDGLRDRLVAAMTRRHKNPSPSCAVRRPMKVLRVITRLNIGGPSVHVFLLTNKLDPRRFSTCLVVGQTEETEGDLTEALIRAGARVVRVGALRRPIHLWHDASALLSLMRRAWQERPRIIHTHMAKAGTLGRLAGLLYNRLGPGRMPSRRALLIHTFHGHVLDGYFSARQSRLFLAIERWLARRTDCLIAVSGAIRDDLLNKGIGQPRQWRVIPLGLDLSSLAHLSFPNGAPPLRVGMVGRLVPIKNPRLFLQALACAIGAYPRGSLQGAIVGDGPLRSELEREACGLGLNRAVRFTGWQQDLCAVYGNLDVACLTSWNEGTPVSLIEAMAAGRAVIATEVGGVRDLLDEDDARPSIPAGGFRVARRGVLVRAGDAQGFAAALNAVASDPALRGQLGRAARRYAVERFSPERLLADISNLYEDMREQR